MVQTQDHPRTGPFWTLGPPFDKLGKGPLADVTYKFQAPEPSSSGEEDFQAYFIF